MGVAAVLVMLLAPAVPAGAQTRAEGAARNAALRGAALASFEGRTIDLSKDWGEAQDCLVWRQGGLLECFRTSEALDAREAQLARRGLGSAPTASTAAYGYWCSSPLRLYEYNWYSGRRLSFWDRGYWQNLADYGFDNQTSSYIVGGCQVYLAEYSDGGGWWYPGPTYPYAGEAAMAWDWQDTISSIYIG